MFELVLFIIIMFVAIISLAALFIFGRKDPYYHNHYLCQCSNQHKNQHKDHIKDQEDN